MGCTIHDPQYIEPAIKSFLEDTINKKVASEASEQSSSSPSSQKEVAKINHNLGPYVRKNGRSTTMEN